MKHKAFKKTMLIFMALFSVLVVIGGVFPPISIAEDNKEITGFEFGNYNSITRRVISSGYRHAFNSSILQTFITYQSGKRSVFELAKSYGVHEISLFMVGASWKLLI